MTIIQIVIPVIWTLIILGCILYVKTNKKFPVTLFSGTDTVKVEASPSLVWSKTSSIAVILGYVFLLLMWVAFILLATDTLTFDAHSSGATFMVLGPTALSIILFFSGYSSKLSNNYVSVNRNDFNKWISDGLIKKKSGDNYVDVNGDRLLHSFDNKNWIK